MTCSYKYATLQGFGETYDGAALRGFGDTYNDAALKGYGDETYNDAALRGYGEETYNDAALRGYGEEGETYNGAALRGCGRLAKGSQEAKDRMAYLRSLRGKKKGGAVLGKGLPKQPKLELPDMALLYGKRPPAKNPMVEKGKKYNIDDIIAAIRKGPMKPFVPYKYKGGSKPLNFMDYIPGPAKTGGVKRSSGGGRGGCGTKRRRGRI